MLFFLRCFASVLCMCLFLLGCNDHQKAVNQFADQELIRMHDAAYRRDASGLIPYLQHARSKYREEAALLLGAVQDTVVWRPLLELLIADSVPSVRAAAAYAIGQLPVTIDTEKLLSSIYDENFDEALIAKMEALGKLTRPSNKHVTSRLILNAPLRSEAWRMGCAKALFWMHMQAIYNDQVMERMPYMLQYTEGASKLALAMAMARYKGPWFEKNSAYLLSWLRIERSPDIRIHLLTMMGKSGSDEFLKNLTDYARAEGVPINLRMAAIRSLQRSGYLKCAMLLPALNDKKSNVVLACLEALTQAINLKEGYTSIINAVDTSNALYTAALAKLRWSVFPERVATELPLALQQAQGDYQKAALLSAASAHKEAINEVFQYAIGDYPPVVRTAAAGVFNALCESGTVRPATDQWLALLNTKDVGVISAVLPAIRSLLPVSESSKVLLPALTSTARALTLPRDIETFNELADALLQAGDSTLQRAANNQPIPLEWETILTIPENRIMRIRTEKGEITIQLDVNRSPASVAYISKLASEGFYNGKFFHRIVPGFVAQGGCPRGDGMGGSDALLRSEWVSHQYDAGCVGLASSGKDTESCQWFITLDQTPHLEGRYTIIGKVISGLEVAQKLIVGDIIQEVTIIDPT